MFNIHKLVDTPVVSKEVVVYNPSVVVENSTPKLAKPSPNNELVTEETMSDVQRNRFYYLTVLYGEDKALLIIRNLESHGVNAWSNVSEKISEASTTEVSPYFQAIANDIVIGKTYSNMDIIKFISILRNKFKLPPYLNADMYKACSDDFLANHIAKAVRSTAKAKKGIKPPVIAYIPLIYLNSFN